MLRRHAPNSLCSQSLRLARIIALTPSRGYLSHSPGNPFFDWPLRLQLVNREPSVDRQGCVPLLAANCAGYNPGLEALKEAAARNAVAGDSDSRDSTASSFVPAWIEI
jgi:hypothetical protein